ncbi:hypothetical protein DEU56DRAFT_759731 [Suillus clintonianus]|uniref:uncharacterized protein n=1 Tax=Suillus clintonianus TaxID=1904413 RepID=UPI001B86FD2F|nr:uncharacterized protein DEU56DRAFT_759731 [Suillus clintonianus]KAG2124380.1 hypothetical protein DEU56DRAFT_759731 [Suillus clintonianus]
MVLASDLFPVVIASLESWRDWQASDWDGLSCQVVTERKGRRGIGIDSKTNGLREDVSDSRIAIQEYRGFVIRLKRVNSREYTSQGRDLNVQGRSGNCTKVKKDISGRQEQAGVHAVRDRALWEHQGKRKSGHEAIDQGFKWKRLASITEGQGRRGSGTQLQRTLLPVPSCTRSSRGGVRSANRSHPYSRVGAPTQLELRFAHKAIQRNSDITLTDGRDIFLSGLSSLSDDTITLVAHAKHATRESLRHKVKQLGWEIQEVQYSELLLKVFERKEKKRLNMAESDFRLFQKLLVGRKLPALPQDAEYLEGSHDSELESLATADEQLYQISSISPLGLRGGTI